MLARFPREFSHFILFEISVRAKPRQIDLPWEEMLDMTASGFHRKSMCFLRFGSHDSRFDGPRVVIENPLLPRKWVPFLREFPHFGLKLYAHEADTKPLTFVALTRNV